MKFRDLIAFDEDEIEKREFPSWARTVVFFAAWAVGLNILAIWYTTRSNYIYFWDSATYWDISRYIAKGGLGNEILKRVYESIQTIDYNYTAGLLSAVFIRLFGESRLVYVLTLVNLYLVPSMIVLYRIILKIGKAPRVTFTAVMMLLPMLVFTAFVGFVDIGGVIGCLLCWLLYYERDGKSAPIYRFVIIGFLLVLLMLWRRWYAFFGVSFLTAMLADSIIQRRGWYKPLLSAAIAGTILIVFFREFTFELLLANYGDMYSSYKFSAMTDFKLITRYFGAIYLLCMLAASIAVIVKENRLALIAPWVQIIVCMAMFMSVQTHGQQHLLLYAPALAVITIEVIAHIKKHWMLIAVLCLGGVTVINIFIPRTQPSSIQDLKYLAPVANFSMLPRTRDDSEEILQLKQALDGVVGEDEYLGVLSSSFTLNEDILRNVEPSLGVKSTRDDYILTLPQVDSRDADFSVYNQVNYVLVATPAQLHLGEDRQKIVVEAVNEFDTWTGIAQSYEEIYDQARQIGNISIRLFKRVRDIPEYEYGQLKAIAEQE